MSTPIAIINGSECYAPWECLDINGNPYTPTSLSYEVWDTTNNINVVTSTVVTPAQSGTITLNSTVNTMNAASYQTEQREVIIKIGIPGGTFRNVPAYYSLLRQPGTP